MEDVQELIGRQGEHYAYNVEDYDFEFDARRLITSCIRARIVAPEAAKQDVPGREPEAEVARDAV